MSIFDEIKAAVDAGKLVQIRPVSRRDVLIRLLYVSKDIWEQLERDHDTDEEIERYASLRASLDRFVAGELLDKQYLKPIKPKGKNV